MKKIALICATLATASLLMIGCSKNYDTNLRQSVYKNLCNLPQEIYEMPDGDCVITAKKEGLTDLSVTIKNKLTGDVLEMTDREVVYHYANTLFFIPFGSDYFNGVDYVKYNGYRYDKEGMDERFDQALRAIQLPLENKILKEVSKVKENTKLK